MGDYHHVPEGGEDRPLGPTGQGHRSWARRFGPVLLAAAVPVLIPALQFGVVFRLWDGFNKPVNREHCICSCWDTVFKGNYETGSAGYKHFYFNCNANTLKIWILTVAALVGLYESVKQCASLTLAGMARPKMLALLASVIYPHYYAWWAYVNYYNDDYYLQFWHQMFFTVTELISTFTVFHLVDRRNYVTPRKVVIIMGIATLHILASGWDQFVANVLRQEGELHQVLRDLGFMFPDILHLILPWLELKEVARRRGPKFPASHLIKTEDFTVCTVLVLTLWLLSAFIKQ